jgi:type IV pilus assembly protein PilC
MPMFHYRAARTDGTVTEASMEATNEANLRLQLERQGLVPLSLGGERSAGSSRGLSLSFLRRRRLSLREFLIFNQEFVALVKAGLPILKTCEVLAERAGSPEFREALEGLRAAIRGGSSISDAMQQYPQYFPDLYRASLHAGEQTGNLVEVLQRYISYLKLLIETRDKVGKALAYPSFLIVVGGAVVGFLLTYVIPTFSDIYSQSDRELPVATQWLLAFVAQIKVTAPWILLGLMAAAVPGIAWVRTEPGRRVVDRLSLRVPIVGNILLKHQLIQLTRTLATVLAAGVPLLTALQITRGALTNRVLAEVVAHATDCVRDGMALAASLRESSLLPPLSIEMLSVGETTGSLEPMLRDLAEFHEGELEYTLSQLTTWIEPVLLLVMGFLVGGIVIVMYLPIFQIAGSV